MELKGRPRRDLGHGWQGAGNPLHGVESIHIDLAVVKVIPYARIHYMELKAEEPAVRQPVVEHLVRESITWS